MIRDLHERARLRLRIAQTTANAKYTVGGRLKERQPPTVTLPKLRGTEMTEKATMDALRTIVRRYEELVELLKEQFDADDLAGLEVSIDDIEENTRTLSETVQRLGAPPVAPG